MTNDIECLFNMSPGIEECSRSPLEELVLQVVKDLPQFQAIAFNLVHQVLTNQAKKLILISGTNTACQVANYFFGMFGGFRIVRFQVKSVLRMLTAFVTLGPWLLGKAWSS